MERGVIIISFSFPRPSDNAIYVETAAGSIPWFIAVELEKEPSGGHRQGAADPHLMETTKGLTPAHRQAPPFRNTSSAPSLHCAQNRTWNTHDYRTSRSEFTQRRPTAVSDAMSLSLDLFGLRARTHTHDTQQKHPSSHSPGGGDLSLAERTRVSAPWFAGP